MTASEESDPPPTENVAWREIFIPAPWDNPSHRGWYRRELVLDRPDWPHRIFLRFEQVNYEATVFLNNRRAGYHRDGYLPFEVEITDSVIRGGTNELVVLVHDETCVATERGIIAPAKSLEQERGIVGDVSVLYRPEIYISDVFVVPFVREKSIRLEVTIDNAGPTRLVILQTNFPGEENAPRLQMRSVVAGRQKTLLVASEGWSNPRLWWPHDPYLMTAQTSLLDENGVLIDQVFTSFGFREFAVSGKRFSLNGIPINLFGSGLHWRPREWSDPRAVYLAAREANVNIVRLHGRPRPRTWYDVADEVGMMLIDESGLYGSHGNFPFEDKRFWKNAQDHVVNLVLRDRNHPSIVMWSISNEMGWKDEGAVSFRYLRDIVSRVEALDDSRPIMAEGDGDMDGRLKITNWHYVEQYPGSWLPRDAYWPERLSEWGRRADTAEGFLERPIYFGEFSSFWNAMEDTMAVYAGDEVYADYWAGPRPSRLRYHAELLQIYVGAFRWCRIAGIAPWTIFESGAVPNIYTGAHREAFKPLKIIIRELTRRFFEDGSTIRNVAICNDTLETQQVVLQFHLLSEGTPTWAFSDRVSIPPAQMRRWKLQVPLPQVSQPKNLTAEYRLVAGGSVVDFVTATYAVFPKDFVLQFDPPVTSAAVYEKGATVSTILSRIGVSVEKIDDLFLSRDARSPVLVIGPHSIDQPTGPWQEAVADFARRGGMVVALQQHVPALWAPERVLLSTQDPHKPIPHRHDDRIDSHNHIRSPRHPLFAFLRSEQFTYWNPDHVVSRYGFWKPRGACRTLLDVGQRLDQATLVEIPFGRGWLRLSQLDVASKFDSEPVARLVLHRLLRVPETRLVRAGLVVGTTDRLSPFLRDHGLRVTRKVRNLRSANTKDLDLLLVDLLSDAAIDAGRLRSFASGGGTIFLTGIVPETFGLLQGIVSGVTLSATEGDVSIKRSLDPLLDGISNADIYWVQQYSTTQHRLSQTLYRAVVGGASICPLTDPTILAIHPIGQGRLILDSSLWLERWRIDSKADRLGSALMLNLGLRVHVPYWDRPRHR